MKLIVTDSKNRNINTFEVNKNVFKIGRSAGNEVCLDNNKVSREHLLIEFKEGKWIGKDLDSTNGTFINNQKVFNTFLINDSLEIIVAGEYSIRFDCENNKRDANKKEEKVPIINTNELESNKIQIDHLLKCKDLIKIGRSENNDVVIQSILVSRQHCELLKKTSGWYLKDLDSTNGTFLNGKKVIGEVKISENDIIGVGNFILYLTKNQGSTHAIFAQKISKLYNGQKIIQSINLELKQSSFTAIMGPSGCGKSTLLKMLNGTIATNDGEIFIENIALEPQNYDFIKKYIGYVPQDDILHQTLSLEQTLDFSAKLRLPLLEDRDRRDKIETVLKQLGINSPELKSRKISQLSGGQRKRVSIAIELLSEPKILFLDEPTSPLDPQSIYDFLTCIRTLVNNGITVIMVTHKPEDLKYVDDVIFLSKGGYMVYHDSKDSLLTHFEKEKIEQIYEQFDSLNEGKKFNLLNSSNNKNYTSKKEIEYKPKYELSQLYWLTLRYFKSKLGDRNNLILTFIQPLAISLLLCAAFDYISLALLFVMSITSIWLGANNAAVEIVNELTIYKREKQVFLNTHFYILSKIIVLNTFNIIQNGIILIILYINFMNETPNFTSFLGIWFAMILISFFATLLGLLLSSLFNSSEKVMTALPLSLIPQIIFSGVIIPLDSNFKAIVSFFCISRWGTELIGRVQDMNHGAVLLNKIDNNLYSSMKLLNSYQTKMFLLFDGMIGNISWMLVGALILYIIIYVKLNQTRKE
jgi:ABC-type multidrug transport system ATPase subunit